jgi:predicted pyridoxine 5'-phosphate oxidase superfamily flavin-nucleotide-binding protein
MNRLYGPVHRSLQDRFDTRRLAENVEARVVLTEIPREHKAFIESRDMFFLSTIDHQGRSTVSYRGGDPGFVRVLDGKTVAIPCYDGNGMFYSMGNLLGNPQVGMHCKLSVMWSGFRHQAIRVDGRTVCFGMYCSAGAWIPICHKPAPCRFMPQYLSPANAISYKN